MNLINSNYKGFEHFKSSIQLNVIKQMYDSSLSMQFRAQTFEDGFSASI